LEIFGCGEVGREPLFGFLRFEGDFVEERLGTVDVSGELRRWRNVLFYLELGGFCCCCHAVSLAILVIRFFVFGSFSQR
jgi:hypothetical protein